MEQTDFKQENTKVGEVDVLDLVHTMNCSTKQDDHLRCVFQIGVLDLLNHMKCGVKKSVFKGMICQTTGWQSWSASWEFPYGKTEPHWIPLFRSLDNMVNCPYSEHGAGSFIIYLRFTKDHKDRYLVLASASDEKMPPISFVVKDKMIEAWAYSVGKQWNKDDVLSRVHVFIADDYFQMVDTLRALYSE